MEIVSEPTYTEETVTDLDIVFAGGESLLLTLREGDTYVNNLDAITVTYKDPKGGTSDIFKRNLLWVNERTRVERRPVTKSDAQSPRPSEPTRP